MRGRAGAHRRHGAAVMARLLVGAVAACLLAGGLAACAWMYSAPAPMRTQRYPSAAAAGARAPTLLVFFPGRGDSAADFAAHGFIDDVRGSGADVDVVAVDASLGYYMKETLVDRAWTDVLAPAVAQGYQHIWLVGISMGGLGSLLVARQHADAVERVILLAPFLGPKSLIKQIDAAGGPRLWIANDRQDPYQRLWTWLQRYGDVQVPPAVGSGPVPDLVLGFGAADSLAPGHKQLAMLLPSDHVTVVAGGHDWTTWRMLWRRYWARAR